MEFTTHEVDPPNERPTTTILRRPLKPCFNRASDSLEEILGKCVGNGASDLGEVGMKLLKKFMMSLALSVQST